jgi:hypothetical protein
MPLPVSSLAVRERTTTVFRVRRVATGLALAVTAALAAAGCTSSQSAGAAGAEAYRPQLTLSEAKAAYTTYVTTSDLAARVGNESLAMSVVQGAAADTLSAEYTIARASNVVPPYTRYQYGTPTYYLPEPTSAAGGPDYFVVSVARSALPGATPLVPSALGTAADVRLPAIGTVLMLFEKLDAGGAWQVASISQVETGESVPVLATDKSGYVVPDALGDLGTQLVRPALTPPLQATVVDDGPTSSATQVVASGPLTTGLYELGATSAQGMAAPPGDVYQWLLEGSSVGRLALHTADGGSLVLYTMYLDLIVQTKSSLDQDVPVLSGQPITVPADVEPLLPPDRRNPTTRLEAQDILSFAAIDPPAADKSAKIQVIAIGGGLRTAFGN